MNLSEINKCDITNFWVKAGKVAKHMRNFATKADFLGLVPGIHILGRTDFYRLFSDLHIHTYTYATTHNKNVNLFLKCICKINM